MLVQMEEVYLSKTRQLSVAGGKQSKVEMGWEEHIQQTYKNLTQNKREDYERETFIGQSVDSAQSG